MSDESKRDPVKSEPTLSGFDINQFLESVVKTQLPDLAKQNPYFGAGIIAGGIEFLGNCLDADPVEADGKSAARFCRALNDLFPPSYHAYSRSAPYTKAERPTHDLYASLRCGMAHVLKPQGVLLTGTLEEATKDGNSHLSIVSRGGADYPVIVVEQFINDFKLAVEKLEGILKSDSSPSKFVGNVLNVWSQ